VIVEIAVVSRNWSSTVKNAELVEVIGLSGLSNDLFSQDCAPTAVDSLRFPLPLRLRI